MLPVVKAVVMTSSVDSLATQKEKLPVKIGPIILSGAGLRVRSLATASVRVESTENRTPSTVSFTSVARKVIEKR